jgi:hypothetical protein
MRSHRDVHVNPLRGRAAGADIEALKRAQDTLGRLHDFEVFSEHVRRMRDDAKLSEGIDVRNLGAILLSAELECYQLHAAFMRDREGLRSIADPPRRRATSSRSSQSPRCQFAVGPCCRRRH